MRSYLRKSNSPLNTIPSDYVPSGDAFWFTIPRGFDEGKTMFYRDSRINGKHPNNTVLFVHGNPECSYTYRKIIQAMINRVKIECRIVAVDHIGFGLSDQATYEMVSMDHARNLLELVRELDLKNITLVIHDWGGPIGIGALLEEPERVTNLIILNSTVFPIPKTGITFENYPISWLGWCYTPYIIPDRLWGNFAAYAIFTNPNKPIPLLMNMVKNFALMEANIYQKNHKEGQSVFKNQFHSKMNVRSSKRLVKQTKSWGWGNKYKTPQLGVRDTAQFYHMIQKSIAEEWGPQGKRIGVKALIGRWDPLGQNKVIAQWVSHLPQLKKNINIFENVGHFIEEIKYREIAKAILEVLTLEN